MKIKPQLLFQGIPQLLRYFLVNQALCGAFECLSQWSGKRNFHYIDWITVFPVNASHNMPASVSQLLNKGIPEQIWPDFKHTSAIQQFAPPFAHPDLCSAQLYGGKVSRLIRIRAERLPSVPALNNLTLWRTSFSGSPLTWLSPATVSRATLRVATETAFCATRFTAQILAREPSVGQGCSDSGSHFQALSSECLRETPAFRPGSSQTFLPSCAGYPSAASPAQQNNTAVSTSRSDAIHPEGVTENG